MPSTLEDIQDKHNEAMIALCEAAEICRDYGHPGTVSLIVRKTREAADAFAELLDYHKRVVGGISLAIDIERAKQ